MVRVPGDRPSRRPGSPRPSRSGTAGPRRVRRTRALGTAVGALGLAVFGVACVPVTPPPPSPVQISASPGLFPSFDPTVSDYVVRCTGAPTTVTVDAQSGSTVSVAGQPAQSGTFSVAVSRTTGESFTLVTQTGTAPATTYYVRCLPTDFPDFSVSVTGTPQAQFYEVATVSDKYPAIFDSNGVPIWWTNPSAPTAFAQLLPDGNFAWIASNGEAQEIALNGSVVHTVEPSGAATDWHDLALLPNGDYLVTMDTDVGGVDLATAWGSAYAGDTDETVIDPVIEEVQPDGTVVWSWDTMAHIPVSETDPQWRSQKVGADWDAYHWNSIDPVLSATTLTGFIASFRHLDAVFDVALPSGAITWKLGGSSTPQNLTIVGDPVFDQGSHFGGQHDARIEDDGTLSVYDDGTNLGRPPRVVDYSLDTATSPGTATYLVAYSDPTAAPSSVCCGSARRLDGDDWVMGWGGTGSVTEIAPNGVRLFWLQLSGALVYRAIPIPAGTLSTATLRADMDAQYP